MAELLLYDDFWPQYGAGRVTTVCGRLTTIWGWPSRCYLWTSDQNLGVAASLLCGDVWPQYGGGRVATICGLLVTIRGWPSRYYVWTSDHNTGMAESLLDFWPQYEGLTKSLLFLDFDVSSFTLRYQPQEKFENSNDPIRSRQSKRKIQYHGHNINKSNISLH